MKLAEWLNTPNPDGSRKVRGEFAAKIGVTPQMISAYCKEPPDCPWPGRTVIEKIAKHTDGAVTANDFAKIEQGSAA